MVPLQAQLLPDFVITQLAVIAQDQRQAKVLRQACDGSLQLRPLLHPDDTAQRRWISPRAWVSCPCARSITLSRSRPSICLSLTSRGCGPFALFLLASIKQYAADRTKLHRF